MNWFPMTQPFFFANQPTVHSGGVSISGGGSVAVAVVLAVAVTVAVAVGFINFGATICKS